LTYSPTEGAHLIDAESYYENLSEAIDQIPAHNCLLVIGDLNAHVSPSGCWTSFHQGPANRNGRMLEDLLLERQLEITNLRFQKRKGKLWTYLSDMNQIKSQIDFIVCRKKWRNSIKNSEAYGSFHSMGSDHRVVIARIKLSLRMSKTKRRNPAPDWDKLKTDIDLQERYAVEVKNRFALLEREGETATERYQHLIDANETASKLLLPKKERKKRSKISEDARVEAARLELRESSNLYHIQATEENRVSVQEAKQNLSDAYKAAQEQLLESQIKELEEASNEGRHQGRDLNAIFWANICGTACPKEAKICGKNAAKNRIMRRLCGEN